MEEILNSGGPLSPSLSWIYVCPLLADSSHGTNISNIKIKWNNDTNTFKRSTNKHSENSKYNWSNTDMMSSGDDRQRQETKRPQEGESRWRELGYD